MRPRIFPLSPRWKSLLTLACCLAVLAYIFNPDRLLLFPTTGPLSSIGATRHFIPFDGGKLEIWVGHSLGWYPGVTPDVYVLRFYGNADRADPNVGTEVFQWTPPGTVEFQGVNYPGFGASTGPAHLDRIGPAALAAFDALHRTADGRPIIVFGTSLGTTAALHVAAHRAVAGVILQNPPPLRQIVLRQFGWWNLWLLAGPVALRIPAALDSLANARAVRAPGVFLLAEKDEIVAPRFQRLVADAYAGEKRMVPLPGAYHNSPLDGPAQVEFHRSVDWLLSKAAPP